MRQLLLALLLILTLDAKSSTPSVNETEPEREKVTTPAYAWLTKDKGFRKLCQSSILDQIPGFGLPPEKRLVHDTCQQTFPEANLTEKTARVFCSKWLPYKVVATVSTNVGVTCKWQAYIECASHEVSIYDSCFWVTKPLPYEVGKAQCPTGSTFAKVISREQVRYLQVLYADTISALWVSNRVEKSEYEAKGGGGQMNYDDYEWDNKAGGYVKKTKATGTILPLQEDGLRNGLVGTLVKATDNATYPTLCVRYPVSQELHYPGDAHRKCMFNYGKCSLFKTRNVYTHDSVGARNVSKFHDTCKMFCKSCFTVLPEMLQNETMAEILEPGEMIHVPIKLWDNQTIATYRANKWCAELTDEQRKKYRKRYETAYLEPKDPNDKTPNPLDNPDIWLPNYPKRECADVMPWAVAYGQLSDKLNGGYGLVDVPPLLRLKLLCVYIPDPIPPMKDLEEVAANVEKVHKAWKKKPASRDGPLGSVLLLLIMLWRQI